MSRPRVAERDHKVHPDSLEYGLCIEVASHREPLPVPASNLPKVILAIDPHGELGLPIVNPARVREHTDQVVQGCKADRRWREEKGVVLLPDSRSRRFTISAGLASIFLVETDQTPVFQSAPIVSLDHERFLTSKGRKVCPTAEEHQQVSHG